MARSIRAIEADYEGDRLRREQALTRDVAYLRSALTILARAPSFEVLSDHTHRKMAIALGEHILLAQRALKGLSLEEPAPRGAVAAEFGLEPVVPTPVREMTAFDLGLQHRAKAPHPPLTEKVK